MWKNELVADIEKKMHEYNPKLTVVRITKYGFNYLVMAVYNVSDYMEEMDPFY